MYETSPTAQSVASTVSLVGIKPDEILVVALLAR